MNVLIRAIMAGLIILMMAACGGSDGPRFKTKPSALAKMNEVVVVTDESLWGSMIGDTIQYLFESPYPLTPSPEPTFDLRMFTVGQLEARPLRKNLRTYLVVANLADESSETTQFVKKDLGEERYQRAMTDPTFHTSIGRDKWAVGQILIYVFADGVDPLAKALRDNYPGIAKKINEHDGPQLYEAAYSRGVMQPAIDAFMEASDGAKVKIPNDYQLVLEDSEDHDLMWFTRDTRKGRMDLLIRAYDYTGPQSVSKDAIKKNFNEFGLRVQSDSPNDRMVINDEDLPILEFETTIGGRYAREYRGLWEMEKEFMGGPFLSYVIVNGDVGKYVQIDGYVLAPGLDKRDMMQQIDLIAKSTEW